MGLLLGVGKNAKKCELIKIEMEKAVKSVRKSFL